MTTPDLKKHLIKRISEIDDPAFLEAIKTILDSKSETFHISSVLREEIKESRNQVKEGLFISQAALDEEFEKWANDK